jgi:hypothetical protein
MSQFRSASGVLEMAVPELKLLKQPVAAPAEEPNWPTSGLL